jgi:HAD superfamily hydrolase (TIGR01450 family)
LRSDKLDKNTFFENIRLFVLDLDGTFYISDRIYSYSMKFLERVRDTGRRFIFFTNNSSETPAFYLEKLRGMGVDLSREDIITSGDVCVDYLNSNHMGASVYLMGTEALREEFESAGIRLFQAGTEQGIPDVVVCAFDKELTYHKLERACTYIRNGAVFLATHEDINCPVDNGFLPDCGAMCAAITLSTGRKPKYLGKPHKETIEIIIEVTGFEREEIAFIGDRLYTDVACGVYNGAKGVLVLSGETNTEDIEKSSVKPDAVFSDLGEIADLL